MKNGEIQKEAKLDNKNTHDVEDTNILPQKINMVDLETALSYMLRREIPRTLQIEGEAYDTLIHWLTVLSKVIIESIDLMKYS